MTKNKTYLYELSIYNEKLKQAYDVIEKSSIVVFEWSIGPGIPVKYLTENISNYGYKAEDFYSGKIDYWDFVHEEDVEETRNAVYKKRASDEKEFKNIYRVLCKDGAIRWVEEWTIWERDSKGNPITEKGIIRDITEQMETAEKLRLSEERYRNLFENACALICTFDNNGKFTSVNNACTNISGYSNVELMNMNIFDLLILPKKYKKIVTNNLASFIRKIQDDNIEFVIHTKSDRRVVLEGRLLVISDKEFSAEIQGVFQDVTLRKEAENKIFYLSYHDKLTGLYNRAYYDEALEKISCLGELPYSLILGDMNGLKKTNDLYGHKAGDRLIQAMAEILKKSCRKSDIVARIGGDEFAIILPRCSEKEADKICKRIKKLCLLYDEGPLKPDIALGFSVKRDFSKTNDDLMLEADKRMYLDKRALEA